MVHQINKKKGTVSKVRSSAIATLGAFWQNLGLYTNTMWTIQPADTGDSVEKKCRSGTLGTRIQFRSRQETSALETLKSCIGLCLISGPNLGGREKAVGMQNLGLCMSFIKSQLLSNLI